MNLNTITSSRRVQQALSFFVAAFFVGTVSFLGVNHYNSSSAISGASMQVSPTGGNYPVGSTISVTIREDSGSIPVNAVQAALKYNASQLQFVDLTEAGSFSLIAANGTGEPGIIRVARGVQTPIAGERPVVTVNFKVLKEGTTALTLDKASSYVVRASDNQDVLEAVSGGSYTATAAGSTPPPPPPAGQTPPPAPGAAAQPVLNLQPNGGTYAKGATIPVKVRVNSPTTGVMVVHAVVKFPTNLVQFVGSDKTQNFPTAFGDKQVGDTIDITRGVAGGSKGVTGEHDVATLNFKVIGDAGSIGVTFTGSSEVFDNSGSTKNVLNLMGSKGALYGIGAVTQPQPPAASPPGPAPTPPAASGGGSGNQTVSNNKTIMRSGGTVAVKPSSGGTASIAADNSTQIAGVVEFEAVASPEILAVNPGDQIVKAEYYLDKKLVATKTKAPFNYVFDTKNLKNGSYAMTIKTFYESGTVDTNSDTLQVRNPVTLSYVLANYTAGIIGTLAALVIIGIVVWRFLLPRLFGGPGAAQAAAGMPMGTAAGSLMGSPAGTDDMTGVAPDPAVVAPTGSDPYQMQNTFSAEQDAAMAAAEPLAMENAQVVQTAEPMDTGTPVQPQPAQSSTADFVVGQTAMPAQDIQPLSPAAQQGSGDNNPGGTQPFVNPPVQPLAGQPDLSAEVPSQPTAGQETPAPRPYDPNKPWG